MKKGATTRRTQRRTYSVYVVELDESKRKAGALEPLYAPDATWEHSLLGIRFESARAFSCCFVPASGPG
jgi:hypothetical protein